MTGCNVETVTGFGEDAPNCETAVKMGTASIPAGSTAKCAEYVVALQAFCTPQGTPNYDSGSCVSSLKTLAANNKNPAGQTGAVAARAFFAACFDFLPAFNTDNGMIFAAHGELAGREYLVMGDGLLKQAGGYFIQWLEI